MVNENLSPLVIEAGDMGRIVQQRIPYRLLLKMEAIEKKEKFKTRTEAINALLEIGIIAYEHKDLIKDEHLKEEIFMQLREGGLVDYFSKLTPTDFMMLWQIARTEARARGLKKI